MRALAPLGFLLGLLLLVLAFGGRDVAAQPGKPAQVGYGTPTPTPTATRTPSPSATATPGPGGKPGSKAKPQVKIALLGGGSVGTGQQVRVFFNTAGKVRLQARSGGRGVGGTSAKFTAKGKKLKRIRFKGLTAPAKVTITARGRSKDGRKAKAVKKSKTIRN